MFLNRKIVFYSSDSSILMKIIFYILLILLAELREVEKNYNL
jgi:hypothetical protein